MLCFPRCSRTQLVGIWGKYLALDLKKIKFSLGFLAVLRMFLGLPDPDLLVRGTVRIQILLSSRKNSN
jgi:hypothetical protein